MLYAHFGAKLPKFRRSRTLSIIRYQNLRDGESRKYPLLKSLYGRSSRGLSDGNHPNKLRGRVQTDEDSSCPPCYAEFFRYNRQRSTASVFVLPPTLTTPI